MAYLSPSLDPLFLLASRFSGNTGTVIHDRAGLRLHIADATFSWDKQDSVLT